MTRQEMIQHAQEIRGRNPFPPASQEELAALPAVQEEFELEADGQKVHIYAVRPKNELTPNCPMFINFHGGGYMKGRFDRDLVYCSRMAHRFGALVWDMDYSLAPEAPFPAAVNEAYAAVSYAFEHSEELGIDPKRILLLGHSAGGGLVAAVCQLAAKSDQLRPAAALMEYFPADMVTDPVDKLTPKQREDPREVGRAETGRLYNLFYSSSEEAGNPLVSPVLAPDEVLRGFPDTMILTAGQDTLGDEDEKLAVRLARQGVNVVLRRFTASPHGFTINRMGEWEEALALHEAFIAAHI